MCALGSKPDALAEMEKQLWQAILQRVCGQNMVQKLEECLAFWKSGAFELGPVTAWLTWGDGMGGEQSDGGEDDGELGGGADGDEAGGGADGGKIGGGTDGDEVGGRADGGEIGGGADGGGGSSGDQVGGETPWAPVQLTETKGGGGAVTTQHESGSD
jgi:hypothetical protein